MTRPNSPRRGQVALILAMAAGMLFGMAGLAIDLLYIYVVRAHLVIATDAAALAAARNFGRGDTPAEQQAEANAMALNMFTSNFPVGHLLTQSASYEAPLIEPGPTPGTRQVTVIGRATAPAFFMGLFGVGDLDVNVEATAIRQDVNLMLVLDRSGSMNRAGAWTILQDVAKDFVEEFDETRDRLGLVVFGAEASLDAAPDYNFEANVQGMIDAHVSNNSGTNLQQGLWLAYDALADLADTSALNVIVFFTDGAATAYSANFDVTSGPCNGQTRPGSAQAPSNSTSNSTMGLNLLDPGPPTVTDDSLQTGCGFAWGTDLSNFVQDLEIADINGTDGSSPRTIPGWGGSGKPAMDGFALRAIASNLAINTGLRARTDAVVPVTIFTVGLGGTSNPPELPLDVDLLKRIANDPILGPGVHDPNQPIGKFFHAPTKQQLGAAFEMVKSEVHRLMQ